jgi:hypothetical protein
LSKCCAFYHTIRTFNPTWNIACAAAHATHKVAGEKTVWNKEVTSNNYSKYGDKKKWLEGENLRLGLDKDGTLFDFLDADDKDSTGPKVC